MKARLLLASTSEVYGGRAVLLKVCIIQMNLNSDSLSLDSLTVLFIWYRSGGMAT